MVERRRRMGTVIVAVLVVLAGYLYGAYEDSQNTFEPEVAGQSSENLPETGLALDALEQLAVKGRAPKTGYEREQFGAGWASFDGCDTRNIILNRDLEEVVVTSQEDCTVLSGTLDDPYSGKQISFTRGFDTSDEVQIDHVVALSDAWQKGAQNLSFEDRVVFANDGLNLLAVDGKLNQQKSDSDAASWLPPNKAYRCQYVARQIAVKKEYQLWVTEAEKSAMKQVLSGCNQQKLPVVSG